VSEEGKRKGDLIGGQKKKRKKKKKKKKEKYAGHAEIRPTPVIGYLTRHGLFREERIAWTGRVTLMCLSGGWKNRTPGSEGDTVEKRKVIGEKSDFTL